MLTVTMDVSGRNFEPRVKLGEGPGDEYFALHLAAKGDPADSREEVVIFLEREQVGALWDALVPALPETVEKASNVA